MMGDCVAACAASPRAIGTHVRHVVRYGVREPSRSRRLALGSLCALSERGERTRRGSLAGEAREDAPISRVSARASALVSVSAPRWALVCPAVPPVPSKLQVYRRPSSMRASRRGGVSPLGPVHMKLTFLHRFE